MLVKLYATSTEARLEQVEQERIAVENSPLAPGAGGRAAEEHRRSAEQLHQTGKEKHYAAENLRPAPEANAAQEAAKQGEVLRLRLGSARTIL